jgi:hypothetical protein
MYFGTHLPFFGPVHHRIRGEEGAWKLMGYQYCDMKNKMGLNDHWVRDWLSFVFRTSQREWLSSRAFGRGLRAIYKAQRRRADNISEILVEKATECTMRYGPNIRFDSDMRSRVLRKMYTFFRTVMSPQILLSPPWSF